MYKDPSGHKACDNADDSGCVTYTADYMLHQFGITAQGMSEEDKWVIYDSARHSGRKFMNLPGNDAESPEEAFKKTHRPIIIIVTNTPIPQKGNCRVNTNIITCHQPPNIKTTLHEFGHVFGNYYWKKTKNNPDENKRYLASDYISDDFMYTSDGYKCGNQKGCVSHPYSQEGYDRTEEFANMYENWMLDGTNINLADGGFDDSYLGGHRRMWMNSDPIWYPEGGMIWFLTNMGLM